MCIISTYLFFWEALMSSKYKARHKVYKGRMTTKKKVFIFAIVLVALVLLIVGGFFVAQKYIVYTADGFHFDFPFLNSVDKKPIEPDIVEIEGDKTKPDGEVEPTPEPEPVKPQTVQAITADITRVSDAAYRAQIIETAKSAGANSISITLLNDNGKLLVPAPDATEGETSILAPFIDENAVQNAAGIAELKAAGFEIIANVSICRNNAVARALREGATKTQSGAIWLDAKNMAWLDPAQQLTKDYTAQVVSACKKAGVSHVVLQEMAYPRVGKINLIVTKPEINREQAIVDLISAAKDAAGEMKIAVQMTDASASLTEDAGKQNAAMIAKVADYLVVFAENPLLEEAARAANPDCQVLYWLMLADNPNDKAKNYILRLE